MYKLTITAGTTYDRNGKTITDGSFALSAIRRYLVKQFGGYTEIATNGGWINEHDQFVAEAGAQFTVLFKGNDVLSPATQDAAAQTLAESVSQFVGKMLSQAAVAVTLEQPLFADIWTMDYTPAERQADARHYAAEAAAVGA